MRDINQIFYQSKSTDVEIAICRFSGTNHLEPTVNEGLMTASKRASNTSYNYLVDKGFGDDLYQ